MSRAQRIAILALALALSATGLLRAPSDRPRGLLGPIAGLAASVEWVRFDVALSDGRTDLAYRRAERALALDPGSTEGWSFFASHLMFERGSAEVERDPVRRSEWIAAGLEALERGERTAREPEKLVHYRALVHGVLAEADDTPEALRPVHAGAARMLLERARAMGLDVDAELTESLEHDHEHH